MKYAVGFTVWNRQDQIGWLLDGVEEHAADAVATRMFFDTCEDASEENFDRFHGAFNQLENVSKDSSREEVCEVGAHNRLIKWFMDETDADALVVLQHDQRLRAPMFPVLDGVLRAYGDKVGYIGGRIGFESGLSRVIGPLWATNPNRERLKPGTWAARTFMNTGPVTYPRTTVRAVGVLDDAFEHWFVWEDYGVRCARAGLKSAVAWCDIRHRGFGPTPNTVWYGDGSLQRDRRCMRKKWGKRW